MDPRLAALLRQFELERLEINLFRGASRDIGSPQVFGGQVLGQALMAAYSTIDGESSGRIVHSLHSYFLRRGDFKLPIVYQVDRSRDGHSFSSRRVIAIQNGEQIFTFAASFQAPQEGIEHQSAMPAVPMPEQLEDSAGALAAMLARLPEKLVRFLIRERPFDVRFVEPLDLQAARPGPPQQHLWLRAVDRLPDDERLHHCLLAYASDFNLLNTATLPHAASIMGGQLVMASIDHAMWFHRPFRIDEWLLYSMDSPSASGARGFARGSIFTRDGRLVASAVQEGLIRVLPPAPSTSASAAS